MSLVAFVQDLMGKYLQAVTDRIKEDTSYEVGAPRFLNPSTCWRRTACPRSARSARRWTC